MFRHLVSPKEVAGIFVEAIQGEGGYVVPTDDFYPALRDLCDRYDIPLVLDEVQSGMGRGGRGVRRVTSSASRGRGEWGRRTPTDATRRRGLRRVRRLHVRHSTTSVPWH